MKTASLEVSRKLVEAGVAIDSFWGWEYLDDDKDGKSVYELIGFFDAMGSVIPAPTACELGELLPFELGEGCVAIEKDFAGRYSIDYIVHNEYEPSDSALPRTFPFFNHDTMADAMGLMLIWLKENGFLDG